MVRIMFRVWLALGLGLGLGVRARVCVRVRVISLYRPTVRYTSVATPLGYPSDACQVERC